jgi:hypothetical protein
VLNRYGIQTEFSGNICINLNVVIQDKSLLVSSRKEKKDRDIKEMANLMAQIENDNHMAGKDFFENDYNETGYRGGNMSGNNNMYR